MNIENLNGQIFKHAREQRKDHDPKWTQEFTAAKLGIGQSYLAQLESQAKFDRAPVALIRRWYRLFRRDIEAAFAEVSR